MKICPNCRQAYTDDGLNFCLNDGSILTYEPDEPKTAVFGSTRVTNEIRPTTEYRPPAAWPNQPLIPHGQQDLQNRPAALAATRKNPDQTLPIISLFLGIFAVLTACFFIGLPLGLGAIATGAFGLRNESENPEKYGGRGVAIGGIVTGAVALAIGLIFLLLIVVS